MRKCWSLVFLLIFAAAPAAFSSNWYVRKGATGSNQGTDWNNAWSEMNKISWSSLACGDTIWLAGGTYTTGLSGSKSCSSGSVLTFNRVLSTDSVPVAAGGWNPSFDSQVILPNISVPGPAAYVTFSGRQWQSNVEGSGGIQIVIPGTSGDGIDASNTGSSGPAIDHVTWTYVEVYGPACVETENCSGGGVVGVQIMPYCSSANRTNLLFDHTSVHRTGEAFRGCGWDSGIIQYSLIYDTHNDGQQHEDIMYSNPPYQNVTWRYNKIFSSPNDGIFFEGGTGAVNWAFYGNVYYHSGGSLITFKPGSSYGPVFIYNNVFENDNTFGDYEPGWLDFSGSMQAGSVVVNNIFENISPGGDGGTPPGADYNAYSTSIGKGDNGAHSFTYNPGTLGSSTMFVNESTGNPVVADFHLTAAGATTFANKGKALAAPYNLDADGNVRGADGGWDIGAFEYGGTKAPAPPPAEPPAPPTNLTGIVE